MAGGTPVVTWATISMTPNVEEQYYWTTPDGDDAVFRFQAFVEVGGTAGNDLHDLGVAVLAGQHGADSDEGELHVDVEILFAAGGHVAGVRIEEMGEAVEIKFKRLDGFHFFVEPDKLIHAFADAFDCGFGNRDGFVLFLQSSFVSKSAFVKVAFLTN